uniref:Ubiquitin conjugation factor E4 B n=1 Tax=Lygus hesperus TaxID=30085 RepID=A0A0A9XLF9_LYGHE
MGLRLRSHILLFNASMDMFMQLALRFTKGVSQNMVAMQISQMLARSFVAFSGSKSKLLKIEHADRYGFRPREILARLVNCLTAFRRSNNFLRCLSQCDIPLADIRNAMQSVMTRQLVSEELL